MIQTLEIIIPDDWHLHLRDKGLMHAVLPATYRQFGRAIIMPNLSPPIVNHKQAAEYKKRIMAQIPSSVAFTPLMTSYLTDHSQADDLIEGWQNGTFTAAKLYPANATTNSEFGISDMTTLMPILEAMARYGMPLLIHGEVTDDDIDIFDREAVFIERTLSPLMKALPELRIVFEHITTKDAAQFVESAGPNIAATITPHHLHINRNALFKGGIRPHLYCLPIAKRAKHQRALRKAATNGNKKFFLGTDSAPHEKKAKENACGCAGIFNAPYAIESYATIFEEENALDKLEGFASLHGPAFYRLPINKGKLTLRKEKIKIEQKYAPNSDNPYELTPFHAGETLAWRAISLAD